MTHEENLKKEVYFYKFVKATVGRKFSGPYLKFVCAVSSKTQLWKTRIRKYTTKVAKTGPKRGYADIYIIDDVIWVPEEVIKKNDLWNSKILITWQPFLGLQLARRDKIPWWLLEAHGGFIRDDEFEKRVNKELLKIEKENC